MRKMLLLTVLVLAVAPGCVYRNGTWEPMFQSAESKVNAAKETFASTVQSLAVLRAGGAFTSKEAADITLYIEATRALLDRWQAAAELDQPTGTYVDEFEGFLRELIAKRIAGKRALALQEK